MKLPGLVQFRFCTLDNKALAELVAEKLNQMYENGRVPFRNIPARPDEDFDLVLAELIVRFMEVTNTPFDEPAKQETT